MRYTLSTPCSTDPTTLLPIADDQASINVRSCSELTPTGGFCTLHSSDPLSTKDSLQPPKQERTIQCPVLSACFFLIYLHCCRVVMYQTSQARHICDMHDAHTGWWKFMAVGGAHSLTGSLGMGWEMSVGSSHKLMLPLLMCTCSRINQSPR